MREVDLVPKKKDYWTTYNNTEERKAFMKQYNAEYRKKHAFYIECPICSPILKGYTFKSSSKYSHVKSQFHQDNLQKQEANAK